MAIFVSVGLLIQHILILELIIINYKNIIILEEKIIPKKSYEAKNIP